MLQRSRARVHVGVAGSIDRMRQLLLGANATVTRCPSRAFLQSSSIKLASGDVSDSISLSQAVHWGGRFRQIKRYSWRLAVE